MSYEGAHLRVKSLWGPARQYPCVKCQRQAQTWAYDGTDPEVLHGNGGGYHLFPYSWWPEFYMPLCKSCHKIMDLALLGRPIRRGRRGVHYKQVGPRTEREWDEYLRQQKMAGGSRPDFSEPCPRSGQMERMA